MDEAAWRRYMIKQIERTAPHPPVKHRPARDPRKRKPVLHLRNWVIKMVNKPVPRITPPLPRPRN